MHAVHWVWRGGTAIQNEMTKSIDIARWVLFLCYIYARLNELNDWIVDISTYRMGG